MTRPQALRELETLDTLIRDADARAAPVDGVAPPLVSNASMLRALKMRRRELELALFGGKRRGRANKGHATKAARKAKARRRIEKATRRAGR